MKSIQRGSSNSIEITSRIRRMISLGESLERDVSTEHQT